MDEEYDVIVLGTGLTVRFRAFITTHTDKTTYYQTILYSAQTFNPLFMRPEVKALHIPARLCHYMDAIIINARDICRWIYQSW